MPDWHREWHTQPDQMSLFLGKAGMECPLCGDVVMHAQWSTPLTLPAPGSPITRVKRNVIQAASWAMVSAGKPLEKYLQTNEGAPYARMWTAAEVQQADQYVANNPVQP